MEKEKRKRNSISKFPFWERKEDTSHQEQKPIVPSLFSHHTTLSAAVQ
jgi:hypothetical protein